MKTVTLELDENMRIGQAIVNALLKSGDLRQDVWTTYGDDKDIDSVEYVVAGTDLFYMADEDLKDKLRS